MFTIKTNIRSYYKYGPTDNKYLREHFLRFIISPNNIVKWYLLMHNIRTRDKYAWNIMHHIPQQSSLSIVISLW